MSLNAFKLKLKSTAATSGLKAINNNLINNTIKNFSILFKNKSSSSYSSFNNTNNQTNFKVKAGSSSNSKQLYLPYSNEKFYKTNKRFVHSLDNLNTPSDLKNQVTGETEGYEKQDFYKDSNKAKNTTDDNNLNKNKKQNNEANIKLFGSNDIDAILAEVNEFFISNSAKKPKRAGGQMFSEDLSDDLNLANFNSNKANQNQTSSSNNFADIHKQKKNLDELNESQLMDLNNGKPNLSTLSEFFQNESGLFEEDMQNEKYEESIFGYKIEQTLPIDEVRKFPFIKKLLYVYKTIFYSQIQKQEFKFFCQNIFKSDEFNLEDLDDFQATQPLEIKIAYYVAFKALRGLSPIFLNKTIKAEIFQKIDSRNLSLMDILVYAKFNVLMQDVNLMYRICDFLNPIFTKSITEARYSELAEKNPDNIPFFLNLFVVLLPCQKFLNLILKKYETLYMNIFASLYNLRKYIFSRRDISPLKAMLHILIKSHANTVINQSELYRKFQMLIDEIVIEYTDNYCSEIIDSTHFLTLCNYFTKYYSTLDNLDEHMIKKILDINFLSLNLMEKYSEEALLLIYRSIENFLLFFDNIKDKVEQNDELSGLLEKIIFNYFTIYSPNITIGSAQLDFSKIKNMDLIYLLKLKYIFATYFSRDNAEASSYLIAINGLIDNSLNNVKHHPVIYSVMGKCLKYASLKDRSKLFEFYNKNIKIFLNDENFYLFVLNYDMLEKYGDIANVVSDYRPFIIRQLIKMFYFNQIYYIFAKPDKLFYTIMAFCNSTHMIEFDISESKKLKKAPSSKKNNSKGEKVYKRFEDSYYPTFPKELYRFLNIIFYKIRTDDAIFNIYASRIVSMLNLVKLTFLFEPQLLKENYFSVINPCIDFYGMNYLDISTLERDLMNLNFITYYISLHNDNQEMMLHQLKQLAKYIVIASKLTENQEKLFFILKRIEETYLLNPQPYDRLEKNPKNPKFMKLIMRIKNEVHQNLKKEENPNLGFLN